jgi:hypothetical protein
MAGVSLPDKLSVEMTFDALAGPGSYDEEDDPQRVFGSHLGSASSGRSKIFMTRNA